MSVFRTLFLVCVVAFGFTACNGDDDNDAMNTALIGSWKIESSETKTDHTSNGSTLNSTLTYVSGDSFIDFSANGSYEQTGSPLYRTTYVINGDTLPPSTAPVNNTSMGTYTVSGDELRILVTNSSLPQGTSDADALKFKVEGNQLTIILDQTKLQEVNGVMVNADVSGIITYRKQ